MMLAGELKRLMEMDLLTGFGATSNRIYYVNATNF